MSTVRYQCSPHHVNDAFYPITSQIWHAAGFVSGEPADGAARQAGGDDRALGAGGEGDRAFPRRRCCRSLSRADIPRSKWRRAEQKERTIAALIALFVGLTKDAPVLALLEDAHWIDPTSLDVFSRLVDRLPDLRALLVSPSARNSPRPGLGRAHVAVAAAQPLRAASGAGDGRSRRRRQGAAGGSAGADRRQDRRRAAVRGGTDQDGARIRPAARGERRLCPWPRR